jgi:plasmid stability protein
MAVMAEQIRAQDGIGALHPVIGVGAGDLQHAVRAEVRRILKETEGDPLAQIKLLINRMHDLRLITDSDVDALNRLADLGNEAVRQKGDARGPYFESRDIYNKMLAGGESSPVAMVLASSAVGSFSISEDGDGAVVFAKASGEWEGRLGAAGAVIGSFWGPAGAAAGAVIGSAVGAAVDECLE